MQAPLTAAKSPLLREKRRFWAAANTENDILRLRSGRSSIRTLRTVLVFERALPGEATEKSCLSIGYSPPFGESQALSETHK